MKYFVILILCTALVSCNNTELESVVPNDVATNSVSLSRSVGDSISVASAEADLPDVWVSCVKTATSCNMTPLSVRFSSPNAANIGTASYNGSSMTISPLFVTEDDKFQVVAIIEHPCSKNHTLKISNGYNYSETIKSKTSIGTVNYTGYIPLSHMNPDGTEKIIVTLSD